MSKQVQFLKVGSVNVTKALHENILDIFKDKGFSAKDVYSKLKIAHSTFHNFNNLKNGVSSKMCHFVKLGGDYIIRNWGNEYQFNSVKNQFELISSSKYELFSKGVYYGYFIRPNTNNLDYFIFHYDKPLSSEDNDGRIKLWSDDKNAEGVLIIDNGTYTIILKSNINYRNFEFLVGRKTEDTHLKTILAMWRDKHFNIYSVPCFIQFIQKPFFKWEEIASKKHEIRKHIIDSTPEFATHFIKQAANMFVHLDKIEIK